MSETQATPAAAAPLDAVLHNTELWCTVRLRSNDRTEERYFVEFELFEHHGQGMSGTPLYEYSDTGMDHGPDLAQAQCWVKGSMKWDGCANFDFASSKEGHVMEHTCTRKDLVRIGERLAWVFDEIHKCMPNTSFL